MQIIIGTRASPLAMAQANEVKNRLEANPQLRPILHPLTTKGDKFIDRPLAEIGGKGLFTHELNTGLDAGTLQIAVHSMKDLETNLPKGHVIGAVLPREDVRDAFISHKYASLFDLPKGACLGTSSLRRGAICRALRPDLKVVEFRGNVQTRLQKLQAGVAVATLLAMAGLNRLQRQDLATYPMAVTEMLPACAQGAIAVTCLAKRRDILGHLAVLNDSKAQLETTMERDFLKQLDGSCRTPIAGLARLGQDGRIEFHGQVLRRDGSQVIAVHRICQKDAAKDAASDAAQEVLDQIGADFFA